MNMRSLRPAVAAAGLAFGCSIACIPAVRAAEPPKAAAPRAAAPSNTTYSQQDVRITWTRTPTSVPPDVPAVLARLNTPEVAGAIGQEVLGITPEEALAAMGDPQSTAAQDGIEVGLVIDLDPKKYPKARPAAKEFAERLVAKFSSLLAEDRRQQEEPKMVQAKEWLSEVQHEHDSVVRRLREKQAEMGGHSPESARAALSKLDDERQRLELELAGMQARQKAVEEWIDRGSKQVQEQAKTDPVIAELEKALVAQEKVVDLARRQFEAGVAQHNSVADAESKLSDVKVQLLERKRAPGGGAGGASDPLAALNRELQNISIEIVDRKARLAFVEKRAGTLQQAAALASEFELMEAERAALRRELEQARQEFRSAQRSAQGPAVRDRVIVLRARQGRHERPEGSTRPE